MSAHNRISSKKKFILFWVGAMSACILCFFAGWFLEKETNAPVAPTPLRLGGYQYISPLLSCNFNATKEFPQDQTIGNDIQSVINRDENSGDITQASVYFSDLTTGRWTNVNGNEKYYPASLGKVPIMMAYFEMAESSDTLLNSYANYPAGLPDLNTQQEIPPTAAITPGQNYTNLQLIQYMIKYSDNDAAQALAVNANQDDLQSVYTDLQIPLDEDVTASTSDIMTPQEYSIVFRTLYNATYLSRDFSEEALQLMTQTTFDQGLVAGVPSSTVVSHKYGLASFVADGIPMQWELHDCGIVYAPGHPYVACVMTKGTTSIAAQETAIADISSVIYNDVEAGD